MSAGFPAKRHFGRCGSGRQNIIEQIEVVGRINAVLASRKDGDRLSPSARPNIRTRWRCRARLAKMIEERSERPRTDVLAADEPQPVEPLFIRQADGFGPRAHFAHNSPQQNPLRHKPSNSKNPKHL